MVKSPNHYNGRKGMKPDIIVCHITEGGYDGAASWLCNPASSCSAHFVVGAKGQITQLVDLKDGAWCNGNSTSPDSRIYYKNSLNPIIRSRAISANYYTYSIEHEGYSTKDRFGVLTEEQYQASLNVMKEIITHMKEAYDIIFQPDCQHLIGHYQIDPKGKPNCPAPNQGMNFPFDRFITDIKAWMGDSSAKLSAPEKENTASFAPYTVIVSKSNALNIRKGAGTSFDITGVIRDKGIYTIVDEYKGWGKLKSGAGWISLNYTERTDKATTQEAPVTSKIVVGSKVKIKPGANTYSGAKVSSFVYSDTWIVSAVSGDRVVVDKNAKNTNSIITPFKIDDLSLVP